MRVGRAAVESERRVTDMTEGEEKPRKGEAKPITASTEMCSA